LNIKKSDEGGKKGDEGASHLLRKDGMYMPVNWGQQEALFRNTTRGNRTVQINLEVRNEKLCSNRVGFMVGKKRCGARTFWGKTNYKKKGQLRDRMANSVNALVKKTREKKTIRLGETKQRRYYHISECGKGCLGRVGK